MRKVLLLSVLTVCTLVSLAQVSDNAKRAALDLVRKNETAIKLPGNGMNDVKVSATYKITGTDISMVYLQQTYQGIPVYNQLKTLAFDAAGKVASDAGDFANSIEKLSHFASAVPGISPVAAVNAALTEARSEAKETPVPISILDNGHKFEFGRLGASTENISAELMWFPTDKGEYKLAWQVFVAPRNTSDYWLIRVDAQTGSILGKQNLTITCKWNKEEHSIEDHLAEKRATKNTENYVVNKTHKGFEFKPFVIGSASYTVIKYPAESPIHPGGAPSVHVDPWTMTPGNATSLKWHSDPADYNFTRGNNVWAQEDRDNNNGTFGIPGNSTTPLPNLTFPVVYDVTQGPLAGNNQQAAIVNLFYMNNIVHDIAYRYGFDEVAGNFQNDNQGRGGAGVDYVIADAQDAAGLNNANFSTPADGSRPRMQMFLWNTTTPNRDGDLDNGIIAHEYGHGISNRFTGGPANVSCLGNAEQAGEGWSDYMSLMMGTNWATATVNDGVIRRGIGTYALGQPITGVGIRRFPYSTDMSIYPLTYANLPGSAVPHGVGEIWCMMIWEMTWEIIKQDNFIETNFLNPPGAVSTWRGNAAAMKLVMEGMRLQACSPGFVNSRNAILQADQLIFGGRYKCSILKAFAKRGLGVNASQGSSGSISDGVADFTVDAGSFNLNPNAATTQPGATIVYTNAVVSGECTPMANFVLRDTLPTTVTYVSGGSYNPANRVVTFSPITLPINSSQNFTTTVTVNAGTYFPPVQFINDPVTAIAPNWTATSTTANVWTTSGTSVRSAPLAFFTPNAAVVSDQILRTTGTFTISSNPTAFSSLSFWHRYATEAGFDGGVVEISTNGGATWTDLGPFMSGKRYDGTLNTGAPIGGRPAFNGNSGASFEKTTINLASFAGQTVSIRFRFGSDGSVGGTGWFIDDILMESAPYVYVKSGLYDASNTRVAYKDSLTPIILPPCTNPAPVVTAPTVTQPNCPAVPTGTIVVNATGTGAIEYSINGGTTFQASNTFTGLAAGNYNIVARYAVEPTCFTGYSGNPVVINATNPPVISTQPVNRIICQNGNTTFAVVSTTTVPAPPTYQWQISTNGGSTWTNLANVAPFSDVTTATLTVTNAGLVYNGNLFRCVLTNICGSINSNNASLTVNPLPVVNSGPSGLCAPVTLTASGTANTYSWSPSTGLNTTTGATVIASPTSTTLYTVTGTITATGCTNTASTLVLGTPATPAITPASPLTLCAGTIQALTVPSTIFSITGGGAVAIPATPNTIGNGSPYPSVLSVSGIPAGARVKAVRLNGMTHTFPGDIDILLQSPTGTNVVVMSDIGGGADIVNVNYTLDDAATAVLSATALNPSGTYKPTNSGVPDTWPAPGPGAITQATPLLSSFTGSMNGNWNLYIVDDAGGDVGTLTSWSIDFEVPTAIWTPVTGLFTDAIASTAYTAGTPVSTVYFRQSPTTQTTYTYTVTNTLGTCSSGPATYNITVNPLPTVTVAPTTAQCGPVSLTASGNATAYSWSPAGGLSATTGAAVTANPSINTVYTVTGTITATGCSATASTTVNATPAAPVVTPASITLCLNSTATFNVQPTVIPTNNNGGPIAIPSSGAATPYPGAISVGGLPASGVRVKSVTINGINHTFPGDIDILLQSPTGQNVVVMSDAGGGTVASNVNLTFDDAAAAILPAALASGTYKPTNTAGPDNFPAPGPGSVTDVNPLLSNFTGNLNGNWNLYVVDDAAGDQGSIANWSITFEIVGAVWSPVTGLFTNAAATAPYVANATPATVWAKPLTSTTYTVTRSTATCTSAATTVPVTVIQPITVTTQPASVAVCEGGSTTFSIVTAGNFQTYQWQISTDGGTTWTNIAVNANNASYSITGATLAQNNTRYRVIVSNSCTTITSAVAILTVNALPTVSASALPARICLSDTLVALTGSPTGGTWSGVGASGNNFIPGATAVGTYTLTYTFTNAAGCTNRATTVAKVESCPERQRLLRNDGMLLFPNPNSGKFFLRVNSTLYNNVTMRIYTSEGHLANGSPNFTGLTYGRLIPVDISHMPSGVYVVKLYYESYIVVVNR
jgi:subtilisin-like proprotein convertase family protein